jgi:hypothetical protein
MAGSFLLPVIFNFGSVKRNFFRVATSIGDGHRKIVHK